MSRLSYGQIRDYVLRRAGGDCSIEEDDLNLLMVASLISVYNRLGNEGGTTSSATLTTVADQEAYAYGSEADDEDPLAVIDRVGTIEDPVTHCLLQSISPCEACYLGGGTCSCGPGWWVQDGSIYLRPKPTTEKEYTVRGAVDVDTTLYDTVGDVRTWRWVALPEQLHQYYALYVLGQAVMDDDPMRGMRWMAQAENELAAWRQAQQRLVRPKHTPLVYGWKADEGGWW